MPQSQSEPEQPVAFENNQPRIAPFPIVGIGASAGGLEAFSQLLEALPVDTGMAFVLIQHLDPTHKSELARILSRVTSLKVTEVTEGMRVEPNNVYVIPPNALLQFAEGAFHLAPRPATAAPLLTIDHFFTSLAKEQSRLAVGVVLSGTGADGAEGLKAIKSACGITFAQDEQSAKYPAMPRSATAAGIVDFVLPPAEIAAELARISLNPYVIPLSDDTNQEVLPEGDGELKEIFSLLLRSTGVDFTHYKEPTMRRRIGRRMLVHRFAQLAEYVAFLRRHPEEVKELFRDALINVTSFFRDPDAYAALAKRISRSIQNKELERSFRSWIPGCSTGEEVYSLAICLHEVFEEAGLRPNFQFFGTDIGEGALQVARSGLYPDRILDEISDARLSRHFTKIDGKFQISKAIRETCIFAKHDLTRDTPFSHLDLISCRNVLIYLDSVLQKGLFPTFHYALNPNGVLFLGSAESVGSSADLFATIDSKYKLYAPKPSTPRLGQILHQHPKRVDTFTQMQVATAVGSHHLGNKVDRLIRDRYAPDAVVINRNWQILQFRGQTGFYLEPAPGEANYHLLRMARGDLGHALREVISDAIDRNAFVEKRGIRVEQRGEVRNISLEVTPLENESDPQHSYLLVFKIVSRQVLEPSDLGERVPQPRDVDQRVKDLERELTYLRSYLRTTEEEHDAALEQLSAVNEELGSANEELQSSNEELSTTKEELESSNEELTTVNEELDTRNQQLRLLNDDLNNLFSAATTPILKVDRELCLQRFTPAAERLGIGPADLLHPIRGLQQRFGTLPEIESLIREVLDTLTIQTYDFQDGESHWWSLSIRPYRTSDHRIDGAVLTFADTDSVQHALEVSEIARQYTDMIFETVREPLVILKPDWHIERANVSFYQVFGSEPAQTEGQSIFALENSRWDISELRSPLEQVLLANKSFANFELEYNDPKNGRRIMLLNARQVRPVLKKSAAILLAFEDVTDRRKAEAEIALNLNETGQELDQTKEDLRALALDLMNAQEEEARRIAGELHDSFAQRLAFLEITVEQYRLGPMGEAHPELHKLLEVLREHISQLSNDVRSLTHRMHPSSLEHLELKNALKDLADEFRRIRPAPVHFSSDGVHTPLPLPIKSAVYRITQEALRNAQKYAPDSPVTVTLTQKENVLRLLISDKGPGFDLAEIRRHGGLGMISMRERARSMKARFQVRSSPGEGVTITLALPLPEVNQ